MFVRLAHSQVPCKRRQLSVERKVTVPPVEAPKSCCPGRSQVRGSETGSVLGPRDSEMGQSGACTGDRPLINNSQPWDRSARAGAAEGGNCAVRGGQRRGPGAPGRLWGQPTLPAKPTPAREMGAAQSGANPSSTGPRLACPGPQAQAGSDGREAGSAETPTYWGVRGITAT